MALSGAIFVILDIMSLAAYPVFVGTILSIISLTRLARREYMSGVVHTMSQLGGKHAKALRDFRAILWVCGTLFSITVLFFISPRLDSLVMTIVWSLTYICEVALGVVPDHPGWKSRWHNIFAYGMALGFLITAVYFCFALQGIYQILSVFILVGMVGSVALTAINRKYFLFYELGYIYLSHIGIVIATLALR